MKASRFLAPLLIISHFLSPVLLIGQDIDIVDITEEEIQSHRNNLIEAGFLQESTEAPGFQAVSIESWLHNASYSNKRASFPTTNSRATDFRPNGSRFYILGRGTLNVVESDLSSSWNIETVNYSRELDISSEMGSEVQGGKVPNGLYIRKNDGQRLWVFNRTEIWEYTLSAAWDVSSATATGYKDLSSEVLRGHDIDFKPDGTVLYVDDRVLGAIHQYELSTPWDIETATLDYILDISNQQEEVRGTQFNQDGSRMFLMDTARREVLEYYLATPYDIRSASYIGSFSVSSQSSNPRGLTFRPDFSRFYVTDATSNHVYQYQVTFPPDPQLSSISVSTSKVQANNQNSARITVTVLNKDGEPVEGIQTKLKAESGTLQPSPSTTRTNSDGEARFDVVNSNVERTEYRAVAGGVELQNTVSVNFIGIDAGLSTISVADDRILADGTDKAEIKVTVRDEDDKPFSNLKVGLLADSGNSTIEAVQSRTDNNGIAIFRISNQTPEQVTYRAQGLGTTISDRVTVNFIGLDPNLSSISLTDDRIQANGSDQAEITVTARDEDNELLNNLNVELLADGGNSTIEAVQSKTDSDGIAIFRVSSQTPERVTYRVRALGTTFSDRVVVDFLGVDPDLSSVSLSDDHIQANGSDQAEITVTVRDEDNELFNNLSVELLTDGGNSTIEAIQNRTDSDGVAVFRVSNQIPENVTYSVQALGTLIHTAVTVNFIPVAPVSLSATDVETRTFTANWELVEGSSSYQLDVATDSVFSSFLPEYEDLNTGRVTSYTVDNAEPGKTYFYRVRAAVDGLTGANSGVIKVTTFPETPVATAASNQNALAFTANWEPTEGARKYRIDVATDPEFEHMVPGYNNKDAGDQISVDVENLTPGTRYYYRVRAEAGSRVSSNSNGIQTSTLTVSTELSIIEQEQLRILANETQSNQVTIQLKSDEGIPLEGLTVALIPDGGQSKIEAVQAQTDEKGQAIFKLSGTQAGTVTYAVTAHETEIGSFTVEYLPNQESLTLGYNYPNPFSAKTTIPVTLPEAMDVEVQVYDLLGKPVQTILKERLEPGYYEVPFSPQGLATGVYFYRLIAADEIMTQRMVLVR